MEKQKKLTRKGVSPEKSAEYAEKLAKMIECKTVWTHEGENNAEFQRFYPIFLSVCLTEIL